jgi:tetratricopeptide (TPR) repeat protein
MEDNLELHSLLEQAWVKMGEEKYTEARTLVEAAHKSCQENDFNALGRIFHIQMQFESDHDEYSKAVKLCQKSVEYYKKANNQDKIAHWTRHLADLQYKLDEYENSELNYRVVIDIYRENPRTHPGNLANALRGFALLPEKQGKNQEAIETWQETKALYNSIQLKEGVDEADERLESLA